MPNYRHIVELPFITGLPGDVAVNVWHSHGDDLTEGAGFADALVTFYQAIDGTILSNQLSASANACKVKTYDLTDPEPRAPVDTQLFTLTPNTSTLPMEVALCLSFQGTRASGLPQARRRGRIFLGPLGGILDASINGRPSATAINTVATAATALLAAESPGTVGLWGVWSPTSGQLIPVDNGWIDNEFDTIRDRGRRATTRTLFS